MPREAFFKPGFASKHVLIVTSISPDDAIDAAVAKKVEYRRGLNTLLVMTEGQKSQLLADVGSRNADGLQTFMFPGLLLDAFDRARTGQCEAYVDCRIELGIDLVGSSGLGINHLHHIVSKGRRLQL